MNSTPKRTAPKSLVTRTHRGTVNVYPGRHAMRRPSTKEPRTTTTPMSAPTTAPSRMPRRQEARMARERGPRSESCSIGVDTAQGSPPANDPDQRPAVRRARWIASLARECVLMQLAQGPSIPRRTTLGASPTTDRDCRAGQRTARAEAARPAALRDRPRRPKRPRPRRMALAPIRHRGPEANAQIQRPAQRGRCNVSLDGASDAVDVEEADPAAPAVAIEHCYRRGEEPRRSEGRQPSPASNSRADCQQERQRH